MTDKKRAVGYTRESSGDEEKDKILLDNQKKAITEHCKSNGWDLVRIYDEGICSGWSMKDRKELTILLTDAEADGFDIAVVDKTDRFGRSMSDALNNKQTLEEAGVVFASVEGIFAEFYEDDLNTHTRMMLAEHERLRIMDRCGKGKRTRADNENRLVIGKRPFAREYDKEKGWSLDEEKAAVIRDAAEQYINGGSLVTISHDIREKHPEMELKYDNLLKILTDRCGDKWVINFRAIKKIRNLKEEKRVTLTIPRILDDLTIRRIKKIRDKNRTTDCRKTVETYPLTGFLRCGKCGRAFIGTTSRTTHMYRHAQNWKEKERDKRVFCDEFKYLNAAKMESFIWKVIYENTLDEEAFARAVERDLPTTEFYDRQQETVDRCAGELDRLKGNLDNLYDMVADGSLKDKGRVKEKELKITIEIHRNEADKKQAEYNLGSAMPLEDRKVHIERMRLAMLDDFGDIEQVKDMSYKDKKARLHGCFSAGSNEGSDRQRGIYLTRNADGTIDADFQANLFTGTETVEGYQTDREYRSEKSGLKGQ